VDAGSSEETISRFPAVSLIRPRTQRDLRTKPLEIRLVDDAGVRECNQIDNYLIADFEGIHMMKSEECAGMRDARVLPVFRS
jgi:hypothetical protein